MKKILLSSTTFLLFISLFAQNKGLKNEAFYVLDKDWKGTDIKKAVYLLRSYQINDTCWHWDTYNMYGPLIKVEHYKDKDGTIPHGDFVYYNKTGTRDSIIEFKNGLQHGDADFYNDTGKIVVQKKYRNGELYQIIDILKEDSIRQLKQKEDVDVTDTTEIESEFNGGIGTWARYLNKNITYPERALNNNIKGTVVVKFIIDKEGVPSNIEIAKSVEFSLDEESMRLIRQSPNWVPAKQKGKKVKSYKSQPITYSFR
jgi:periplasmic protein TonB